MNVHKIITAILLTVLGLPLAHAQNPQDPKPRVIVFVHGLHGDKDTWRAANGAYWPDLLRSDPHFAHSDVVVAQYPTPSSRGQYSSAQLAELLFKQLRQQHVWDHREVVFIAHSLGGILTEVMLLNHPAEAARVPFVVSYATPHQGSFVATFAKLYDNDPLLSDLRDGDDNNFLTDLEQRWRSSTTVATVRRYCAYEGQDTAADSRVGRALHVHTRVVSYYSATYGCDTDTPPEKINADHIDIVKPASRNAAAYTFFARVYHQHPILQITDTVRDYKLSGLEVTCNQLRQEPDLPVPVALSAAAHEQLLAADAEFTDKVKIRDITGPTVTSVDPLGIVHIGYSFKGEGRALGFIGCPTGSASLVVHFHIRTTVPIVE